MNKAIALLIESEDVQIRQRIAASEVVDQSSIQMESMIFKRICSRMSLDTELMKGAVYDSILEDILSVVPELDFVQDSQYWMILD